jgi:hypothetical protein
MSNMEHLLVINQGFISKMLVSGITSYLEVWVCLLTVMVVDVVSRGKKLSPVFLNVWKMLLDKSRE